MRAEIARLNESTLDAIGLDKATIAAFRHIAKQVGDVLNATTLPEVAAGADASSPVISSLQIAVKALQALTDALEANQAEPQTPDRHSQRIAELQAENERAAIEASAMRRALDELRAELEAVQVSNVKLSRRVSDLENGVN